MNISKKIVLLGHFGVGKTSLIRRFIDKAFNDDYLVTLGVSVKKKEVSIDKHKITLIIWDIEGNNFIHNVRQSYLLGTSGFIYVFDLSRPETYSHLEDEIKYLEVHFPDIPRIIIGNKKDLVTLKEKKALFEEKNIVIHTYSSAKTGSGVEEIFTLLSKKILKNEST